MDLWNLFSIEGNGGNRANRGNGEETAGSLCRYTVGMMYCRVYTHTEYAHSRMRGQRESTERYLMRCRLPSFYHTAYTPNTLYTLVFAVPRLSHSSVRSQLFFCSQLGFLYGERGE